MASHWPLWRLWLSGKGTKAELWTHPTWTRQAVLDANDLLDAREEAEAVAREKATKK